MKNKKTLVALATFLILVFHLWIPILKGNLYETYLQSICYIGVDIFFFVSASSFAFKKIDYKPFLKNRFGKVYLNFFLFTILAAIYKQWNFSKVISILTGYEFLIKGGGSFLWFLPAIFFFYFLIPIYKKVEEKYPFKTPLVFFFLWILFSYLVSTFTSYDAMFILTNRIPIFFLGFYCAKYDLIGKLKKKKGTFLFCSILLFLLGNIVSYQTFLQHISFSFIKQSYYLLNLPLIMGIICFVELFPSFKWMDYISSFSLELYAFQMIFGYRLLNWFYQKIDLGVLCFLFTVGILFLMSVLFQKMVHKIKGYVFST